MLNHRQIEAFRAAMELGSATAAAEALHVSQPAVSRLIADLERRVGFELFERRQRGLHPTPDGLQLFEEVQRSFRGLERIAETAEAIRSHRVGRVRIIAMPVYADGFVSRVVGAYLTRHPGVFVELETAAKTDTVESVLSEQYDIGVATLPVPSPGIEATRLGDQEAVCVFPPTHPFANGQEVKVPDLAAEPFIALPVGSPFRFLVDRLFREAGIGPRLVAEARTQRAICHMVASGAGISIVDSSVVQELQFDGLEMRRLRPRLTWTVAALRPQRTTPSRAAVALLNELMAHAKESVPAAG